MRCVRDEVSSICYFEKAHALLPLALVNILPHTAHIHTQTQTHTQTHIIQAKKKCPHDAIIITRSNNTESMERMRWIERRRKNQLFNIFPLLGNFFLLRKLGFRCSYAKGMRDFSSHYSALEGVDTHCSSSNKREK